MTNYENLEQAARSRLVFFRRLAEGGEQDEFRQAGRDSARNTMLDTQGRSFTIDFYHHPEFRIGALEELLAQAHREAALIVGEKPTVVLMRCADERQEDGTWLELPFEQYDKNNPGDFVCTQCGWHQASFEAGCFELCMSATWHTQESYDVFAAEARKGGHKPPAVAPIRTYEVAR